MQRGALVVISLVDGHPSRRSEAAQSLEVAARRGVAPGEGIGIGSGIGIGLGSGLGLGLGLGLG